MSARKRQLDPRARVPVAIAATVSSALLIAAQLDLTRRPTAAVRGPKWRWRLICLINTVGPLAYFRFGRRSAPVART